jgi:catechol 2,3-dioxygenase-like lactoylglutathione lyase family enzyme
MENFHGRCVFFVKDAERSLAFYTKSLGFSLDWNYKEEDRAFVFQVSLFGFQLILNQAEDLNEKRAGCGRAFIGLGDDQLESFRKHIQEHNIQTAIVRWGEPTVAITDIDENELFFWLPDGERKKLEPELAKPESERSTYP